MTIPNQATDSSEAGYLQPTPPLPPGQVPTGQPLEDYLQQFIAGVAHMDGTLVRPRWQPEPANLPDWGTDWCSVGLVRVQPIGVYAWVEHHPLDHQGDGASEMQRHEEFEVLCSFYGPHASSYADNLQSGLSVWQNWSALKLVGLAYIECKDPVIAPELLRERWWNRYDITVTMRRIVRRTYPVLNILEVFSRVRTETGYETQSTATQISGGPILPPPYEPPVLTP
jgi:hypothetical protein